MSSKCNCGKILKPGYIRCSKCEAARRDRVESLRWMADARETIMKDLECEIAAVADERVARKALVAALRSANCHCREIKHKKADRHDHDAPCPVEARIAAALALAAELP